MIKFTLLLCLVWGCLGQFNDPDWRVNGWRGQGNHNFPPLPRSFPIFADVTTTTKSLTTKPTEAPTAPTPVTTTAPPTCSGMFSCADCGTAQVCRPTPTGFVQLRTLSCPPTQPYCNAVSGSCSSVPDSTCGLKDNFICPSDGYFPDPTNCTIYHACNNFQSQMFKCADKQVYDPENSECREGAECSFNVNCVGASETKLEMGNTHFFTYCSGGQPLVVSRCPGEYKLNSTSQICEPVCEKDGLMADLSDCTRFYQCTTQYINAKLSIPIRENLACPAGEAFAPESYQCIPKTMTTCKM